MNAAKALVRKAFARAAASYEEVAEFQRAAAGQLMEGLPFDLLPARILDSGCGTGHGLPLLNRRWPMAQVVSLDFAFAMVQRLARGSGQLCGDAECLPLVAQSMDFYWSNLALQWCDADSFMREAARVMKPGAKLAVSTLGRDTFNELRTAFKGVDTYRHTIDFCDMARLLSAFSGAGLRVHQLKGVPTVLHYPDISMLLDAVRKLGANRVTGVNRRGGLMGKVEWTRFVAQYERLRTTSGLPLSYDTILVYAEK